MEVLDTTVVNVSLPHIAGNLSATIDESTWALTSYLVANAIILPLTGWIANYFGRKRLLLDVGGGLHGRVVPVRPRAQPAAADPVPRDPGASPGARCSRSRRRCCSRPFARRSAGAPWASGASGIVVAPILGPVLGGWLTDSYSWRWVFYINIPVGHRCRCC